MDIQSNLKEVRAQLPPQVSLVAVSKFHPNEAILKLVARCWKPPRGKS